MYKIWIVEDDKTIAKETASFLKKWGYETGYVKDFKQVEKECLEFSPHLILMDISLPFYDGFYWCQEIRKKSSVPILFLSSSSDNMSIIMLQSPLIFMYWQQKFKPFCEGLILTRSRLHTWNIRELCFILQMAPFTIMVRK